MMELGLLSLLNRDTLIRVSITYRRLGECALVASKACAVCVTRWTETLPHSVVNIQGHLPTVLGLVDYVSCARLCLRRVQQNSAER